MGRQLVGLALFLAGILLMLETVGVGTALMDRLFLPLLIIGFGILLLLRRRTADRRRPTAAERRPSGVGRRRSTPPRGERLAVPREEALKARLRIYAPAGTLHLQAGDSGEDFLVGDIFGGARAHAQLSGPMLVADLEPDPEAPAYRGTPHWQLRVNPDVALRLEVETGTGEAELDLRELPLLELELTTGTGPTILRLPSPRDLSCEVDVIVGIGGITVEAPDDVPLLLENGDRPGTVVVEHPRLLGPGAENDTGPAPALQLRLVDGPGRAVVRATADRRPPTADGS